MTDSGQFEAFVRMYQDMVYGTAVRLLGNSAEAEDVAQTVFLRAFQRFEDIADSPTVAGWLKTVTRNACLNHLSRYRSRWRLFSELGTGHDDTPAEHERKLISTSSPATEFEQADDRHRLELALGRLPDHQRVPLVLFHFEGATYQEIANLLCVTVGKVKTDIHRGREALRKHLLSGHAAS